MRNGAVVIPDVPLGISEGHARFFRALKEAVEILQGNHPRADEQWRAPTYEDVSGRLLYDRGDPTAADFTVSDLITDGVWRKLDLRPIIPVGATAAKLRVTIEDDLAGSIITFRKRGNDNEVSIFRMVTQDANDALHGADIVFCNDDRLIEYNATNTTWTTINIVVTGYLL